jgi:hypothetical protein
MARPKGIAGEKAGVAKVRGEAEETAELGRELKAMKARALGGDQEKSRAEVKRWMKKKEGGKEHMA